jgi:hypothetical protein
MQKKYGKFYADWRDEKGARHRKACSSAKAAKRFTRKMLSQAASKKDQPRATSRRSAKRGPKTRQATATTTTA